MFHHQPSSSRVQTPQTTHESLLNRASRLVNQIRSDPVGVTERHTRRKRKRSSFMNSAEKEIQRKLVIIDYPGPSPSEVMVLHEYDKIFDGCISFVPSFSEDDLRELISSLVQEKNSLFHNLCDICSMDFEFVRVANKRVRKPDGHPVFNGSGIKDIYGRGSIYVRLTKCVSKVRNYCIKNL